MTQLVEAQTDAGSVLFEVTDATTAGPQRVTRDGGNVIAHLDERLDTALAAVRPAAATVLHTFTELAPGEVEIEFGLTVDAQAGAVIAKTGVAGHFTIKLTWTRDGTQRPPARPVTAVTAERTDLAERSKDSAV